MAGGLSLHSSAAAPVKHFSPMLPSFCDFFLRKAVHLENRQISSSCINNFLLLKPQTPGNCLKASCRLKVRAEAALKVMRGIIIMKRECTWWRKSMNKNYRLKTFLRLLCARQSQAASSVHWEKGRILTIVWMLSQTESSGFQGSYQDFACSITEKICIYS